MQRALASGGPAVIEVVTEREQPYSGLPLPGWADYPTPEYVGKKNEPDDLSYLFSSAKTSGNIGLAVYCA